MKINKNQKIILTFGQLKRLINESNGAFWLNNTFNGPTKMTCYDIKWENPHKELPTYIKGIYVPFYGYLSDNKLLRTNYIEAAQDVLEGTFYERPIDFEWQIDDYGE